MSLAAYTDFKSENAHLKVKSSGKEDGKMHQMPSVSSSRGRPIYKQFVIHTAIK